MKTRRLLWLCLLAGLRLLPPPEAGAADASYYGVVKNQFLAQTNSSAPTSLASNAFIFEAFVAATADGAVTNATVTIPGGASHPLLLDSNGASLRYQFATNTQSHLDSVFPASGSYNLSMQTVHDGTKSASLTFPLALLSPSPIRVTNVDEAQNVDPTLDFTLRWTISGGSALQLVQLLVLDSSSNIVFSSPLPFTPGALTGTSTALAIPAGSLEAGATLEAHLAIAQPGLPNTTAYPGATGVAALAKDTAFSIRTRPDPPPPVLSILPRLGSKFQMRVTGEANRTYHLEATEGFQGWTSVLTTNSASGTFDWADPVSSDLLRRFYRVRLGQ